MKYTKIDDGQIFLYVGLDDKDISKFLQDSRLTSDDGLLTVVEQTEEQDYIGGEIHGSRPNLHFELNVGRNVFVEVSKRNPISEAELEDSSCRQGRFANSHRLYLYHRKGAE